MILVGHLDNASILFDNFFLFENLESMHNFTVLLVLSRDLLGLKDHLDPMENVGLAELMVYQEQVELMAKMVPPVVMESQEHQDFLYVLSIC